MKKQTAILGLLAIFTLFVSGCLTVEKKEYTFEFTGENSGILTIRYINIISLIDDGADVSDSDFDELVNSYLYGSEIDEEFPMANVLSKRLFEEDSVLCAEVKIEFHDLAAVKLHQFDKDSYFIYALCQCMNSEGYYSSNGRFAGNDVPVVVWPANTKTLKLTTLVTEPDESAVSLLQNYLNWK